VDWIDSFMAYTEGQPTPPRFRRWAAIGAIAAALERRVWTVTMGRPTYPNLYVLLVGPPTAGKTVAIDIVYDFWRETKALHLAPKGMTTAALVDSLKEAAHNRLYEGRLVEYHSLQIAAPEFGTFIHAHDLEMMANLNDIWDSPRTYGQKRRHVNGGKTIEIMFPQINILAGAQPGFLASVMPEEAWSMGFTSRLLMIYGQEAPQVSLFSGKTLQVDTAKHLQLQMSKMTKIHGQFQWTPDAANEIERWHATKLTPEPTHSRLQHYTGRRVRQYLKVLPGLAEGTVFIHLQLQPVISIAADGKTATGRWRALTHFGQVGKRTQMGEGIYENAYVKEEGVWKISKLHYYPEYMVDTRDGWMKPGEALLGQFENLPPDRPQTEQFRMFPGVYIPPFSYGNPVTGRR